MFDRFIKVMSAIFLLALAWAWVVRGDTLHFVETCCRVK